ncbi:unnamed protein product [Closterium sp. NIES-54]
MVYSCPDCPGTGFTTRGNVTNHRYGGRCPGNAHHAAAANSGNPFLMTRHNAASMPSPTLSIPSPTPSIPFPTLSMPSPPRAAVDPEPLRGNEGSTHDNMVPDSFHPSPTPSNSVESTPDVLPDDATSVHTNGEAECSTNDGDESPSFVFLDAFVHWLLTCGVSKKKVDELLQFFNHHGACLEQLRELRNMRDVEKYADDHAPDAHWNWKKAKSHVLLNPYLCLMPDIMHQADLGILEYIIDAIRAQCTDTEREGPAPSGVSQVDPAEPVEVAVDSGAASGGAGPAGAGTGGAESGGAESGRAEPGGAEPGGVEPEGTSSGASLSTAAS